MTDDLDITIVVASPEDAVFDDAKFSHHYRGFWNHVIPAGTAALCGYINSETATGHTFPTKPRCPICNALCNQA